MSGVAGNAMNCAEVRDWLRCDFDGAAEPSGDVAAHLDRCADCREVAAAHKALAADARRVLPEPDVPVGFTAAVMDVVGEGSSDAVLADAVRRRWTRWWPVLVPVVLAAVLLSRSDRETARTGVEAGDASAVADDVAATDAREREPERSARPLVRATAEWSKLLQRATDGDAVARRDLRVLRTRIDGALYDAALREAVAERLTELEVRRERAGSAATRTALAQAIAALKKQINQSRSDR